MFRQLCLIAVAVAALVPGAVAQRGGSRTNDGDTSVYTQREPKNRLDRVADYLKLSREQKKDFKDIMDAGQKEAAPLREQLIESRAELAEAITAGKGADAVGRATKSYADLEARMAAIEMNAFARIFKLLDAGQQEKVRPVFTMMNGIFKSRNWMVIE
jgi:Spy/CpxP family protein refolding chaperone